MLIMKILAGMTFLFLIGSHKIYIYIMKPIFTIHAGEYLVAATLERQFPQYHIWLPSKDSGIDLLLTKHDNTKTCSLQVKFSKDFSTTHTKEIFRPDIKGAGWWTLNRKKIVSSKSDFWVFILYN